jgi:membrane protease YdiL (CAAX protease family)
MQETEFKRPIIDRHPALNLVLIFIVVGLGFMFVGPFIGILIAAPFYPGSIEDLGQAIMDPIGHPELKIPLYIMQGCATAIGLIVAPMLIMANTPTPVPSLFRNKKFDITPALLTAFAVVTFMGLNSIFIEWNSNVQLPESAKAIEEWARGYENAAEVLTKFLTTFDSEAQLIVALIVIAVLPAIGEEIVFRGLIQNEFFRATKNHHAAIWIAAFLFSAIHFQFFGFVPRLLLGALFGYLYYWSGNLWMSIVAHFVNNGLSVMAMYFYQKGTFTFDLETPEAAPLNVILISTVLTGGLLYYFYKYFEHRKPPVSQL